MRTEVEYKDKNRYHSTNEEKGHLDKLNSDFLSDCRQATEARRQVRPWAQGSIKPGQTLLDIANGIEDSARRLFSYDGLTKGDPLIASIDFPTRLNIGNFVANLGVQYHGWCCYTTNRKAERRRGWYTRRVFGLHRRMD
ncbi:hypothetical protein F4821DRAFT_250742 [Hypoxylon rubiginosum]|uniref:Uncharacterized protein n=1 Tax=Hypoxylon rubiginosum TaxID=110542 RepID=A0ACC0CK58_9PEZI|nr:hypothetical protein F4821DRAFT_250742 [Hypoxylon rubiginosum]